MPKFTRSSSSTTPLRRKLVIVGDGACGKTCLLLRQHEGAYYENDYSPTIFENYITDLTLPSGQALELALWDTAGQEDYDRLRPLSYPDSDLILIAFSVASPDSLSNVTEKWVPEVGHFAPGVPTLLVGLKSDLRGDPEAMRRLWEEEGGGRRMVVREEAEGVAREGGCRGYLECSSKTGEGVREVFEAAAGWAVRHRVKPKRCGRGRMGGCVVL